MVSRKKQRKEKEMKIREFLKVCNENLYDVDMYTDYTDDLAICYCGGVTMTAEGEVEFGDILELEVDWSYGDCEAIVKINHIENEYEVEELNRLLVKFFKCSAGFCTEDYYKKWFIDV